MIIGLCGYARAGKDTVARVLVEEFKFVKIAFADPLREMALAIDPMISLAGCDYDTAMVIRKHPRAFDATPPVTIGAFNISARYSVIIDALGYERAKSLPDFRRFLQRLGTEGGRGCLWESIWIDAFERRAQAVIAAGKSVVISDVRFPNEAAWAAEHGELWRIDRAGLTEGAHESEAHVKHFSPHRSLVNDSTIAVLEERARNLLLLAGTQY